MDDNQQNDVQKDDSQGVSLEGALETISNPEVSEKEPVYENLVAPVADAVKEDTVSKVTSIVSNQEPNVVDMRIPREKPQAVSPDAQELTKTADEKEEDFIEHVDGTHSIKP